MTLHPSQDEARAIPLLKWSGPKMDFRFRWRLPFSPSLSNVLIRLVHFPHVIQLADRGTIEPLEDRKTQTETVLQKHRSDGHTSLSLRLL